MSHSSHSFFLSLFLLISIPLNSQDFTVQPNSNAPEELSQLNYMVGDWELVSYGRNASGQFEAVPYRTNFRAYYLADGYSLQSESYDQASRDNFFGTYIFFFDTVSNVFRITFFNAKKARIVQFEGKQSDTNQLTISNSGSYAQLKNFLYKEVDQIISHDKFVKHLYKSTDNGKTWQEMNYYYEYLRKR